MCDETRDEIEINGEGITRLPYIAETASRIMSKMVSKMQVVGPKKVNFHKLNDTAYLAVVASECLWDMLGNLLDDQDLDDVCKDCRDKEAKEQAKVEVKH